MRDEVSITLLYLRDLLQTRFASSKCDSREHQFFPKIQSKTTQVKGFRPTFLDKFSSWILYIFVTQYEVLQLVMNSFLVNNSRLQFVRGMHSKWMAMSSQTEKQREVQFLNPFDRLLSSHTPHLHVSFFNFSSSFLQNWISTLLSSSQSNHGNNSGSTETPAATQRTATKNVWTMIEPW